MAYTNIIVRGLISRVAAPLRLWICLQSYCFLSFIHFFANHFSP